MKNPILILVSGPPGAGKSTFSKDLVKEFGFTWLEIDCVGDPFSLTRDHEYISNLEPRLIDGLLNLAALNLSAQQSVLLDLPWKHLLLNSLELMVRIQELAVAMQAKLVIFECILSPDELRRRITNRNAYRDFDKIENDTAWQNFLVNIRFYEKNPLPHISIDVENTSPLKNFDIAREHILEVNSIEVVS